MPNGGWVGKKNAPTRGSASGVWDMREVGDNVQAKSWPGVTPYSSGSLMEAVDVAAAAVVDGTFEDRTFALSGGLNLPVQFTSFAAAQTIAGDTSWGSATNDDRMVVAKLNSDLTINSTKTLTTQARKRGLCIFVRGNCTINGKISMKAKGAATPGVSLLVLGNHTIPSAGGPINAITLSGIATDGYMGASGNGGGGSGGGGASQGGAGGRGNHGTTFSGGSGGGAAYDVASNDGAANAGAGGAGVAPTNVGNRGGSGGGAGNTGGAGAAGCGTGTAGSAGTTGTGGLLILVVEGTLTMGTAGEIDCDGSDGGAGGNPNGNGGGGSGGGIIKVFYATLINSNVTLGVQTFHAWGGMGGLSSGGSTPTRGGVGGPGTVDVVPGVAANQGRSQILYYTGGTQDFVVPAGVTSLTVECFGAQGGEFLSAGNSTYFYMGGNGGYTKATIAVTPGETLRAFVGGMGVFSYSSQTTGSAGGYNGGGAGGDNNHAANYHAGCGGGGGTDIRRGAYALADRLVIAGGGGGGHTYVAPYVGAAGGGATAAGGSGSGGGAGTGDSPGVAGTLGNGGGAAVASYFGSAGGGGGWYGGGSSGSGGGGGATGGGGGSANGQGTAGVTAGGGGGGGFVVSGGTSIVGANGVWKGHGKINLSW